METGKLLERESRRWPDLPTAPRVEGTGHVCSHAQVMSVPMPRFRSEENPEGPAGGRWCGGATEVPLPSKALNRGKGSAFAFLRLEWELWVRMLMTHEVLAGQGPQEWGRKCPLQRGWGNLADRQILCSSPVSHTHTTHDAHTLTLHKHTSTQAVGVRVQ